VSFFTRRLDSSQRLARLLSWISTTLAINRGLPMLAGTILVVMSCLVTGIVIPIIALTEAVADIWLLLCIPSLILHLGIFIAFIGFMMSEPLGRGYKE
jgi:hypothetical protein